MCKVWGVVTRKGGVGKTTTSTTMAYLLAKAGYKVALIDFDGQRHSTKLSGVMLPEKLPITIYEILSSLVMGEELPEIETYIIHTESGVDLIPANNRLDYFDKLMCNTDFAEYKLKEYVDTIRDRYDYILIDGMPKMGTAMINIMISCDGLIVPVQSETLAVEGMGEFMRAFHRIKTQANKNLEIEGISWILGEVPYNKRIVTIEQGCREFDLTAEDEEGTVLNNVVHLVTRFSDDPKQNINMVKLLETTLTINPDCIAVAEMKGGESMQAINAANTGHAVITTTHANSCEDTYYRMVTLCKQEQPSMDDATLQGLATKAFPLVAFAKRLEDNSRRVMEITECEILPDGRRKMRTLYRFNITDNIIVDGRPKIIGHYEKVENLSEGLQKRLRENGLPLKLQEQLMAKG